MPCYEINLISVEFKGKSKEILKKMGATIIDNIAYVDNVEINLETGTAKYWDQDRINAVKRKYSLKAIETLAKKKMWTAKINGQKATLTKW